MVSIWPWKGELSAADFEKTLSALAGKIQRANKRQDNLRQRARKVKVVWTLYAGFAYMLTALMLTLVTGWQSWGAVEYTAVAGGPLIIYGIRKGLTAYYEYRITSTQAYLENLYKTRDDTIEKLKTATKYNSTQELLQKYGNEKPAPKHEHPPTHRRKSSGRNEHHHHNLQPQPQRTNLPPPPTANIVRPPSAGGPVFPPTSTPQRNLTPIEVPPAALQQPPIPQPGAEFAPNAFSAPSTYISEPHWYDRLFDVLLGEDESSARNRIVLICQHCRLVNGQAPPGTKRLEDLGKWRCGGCGGLNGVDTEANRIVKKIKEQQRIGSVPRVLVDSVSQDGSYYDEEEDDDEDDDDGQSDGATDRKSEVSSVELVDKLEESPPTNSTHSKAKQRKKYQWNEEML